VSREVGRALRFGRARRDFLFRHDLSWCVRPAADRLEALIRAEGVTLVYCNNQPSSNLEGILAAGAARVPCVAHIRKETDLRPQEAAAANAHVTRFICVSKAMRDRYVAQGIAGERIAVVYNGFDAERSRPVPDTETYAAWRVAPGTPVVGAVGSLLKLKGFDVLLEAFAGLRRDGLSEARLVIVGDGPERAALTALARRLGLEGAAHFAGFLRDPLPVMARFEVMAISSTTEGCPRSILEAMFLGVPVVGFAVGGVPELVADGETGLLVRERAALPLTAALAMLLRDAPRRRAMGEATRARVAEYFSVDRYAAAVEAVLGEAMAAAR
jgi:glycosyltransferase involved in cell wall biosynthesis